MAKMMTFASLDPLFGPPTGNPTDYLKQHNFSVGDISLYYREALQKGPYMLELAFQESEMLEENILAPLIGGDYQNKEQVREHIIQVCQKFRNIQVIDELTVELKENYISKALNESGVSADIFLPPDGFLFFLNKISGYDVSDLAFSVLMNQGILFHAIDHQLRALSISDSRIKNMGGLSSHTKIKLRLNLVSKQITAKEKQKVQLEQAGKKEDAEKLAREIALYQNCLGKMTEYLSQNEKTLETLFRCTSTLEQYVGTEVLQKVSEMPATQSGSESHSIENTTMAEAMEEVTRLTKQSMEFLGEDRIEFSHNLLGAALENQQTKIEKARGLFEKIPNSYPQKPVLANRLGVILNALGNPDKASEYFRRALILLPASKRQERAPIESNLFHALLNKGSFDAALKYMMESLQTGSEECNVFDVERFTPQKILGVGGMGVTFLCQDVYEERQVVVKTLWRYDVSGSLKDTFSEAFTAKKIGDNRIIKIYDIGRHRANRPFIVMEYCEGIDLQRYLLDLKQGNPLDIQEALQIILDVAKGLDAAHTLNPPIVHRDIKPNNILYNPETRDVKIIDFGIACVLPSAEEMGRSVTRTSGSVIAKNMAGTWGYMSPEQQMGEKNLMPQSDIFALGKTLMFLLTAKTPPPENIFALKPEVRNCVGELVGYCLMPQASERYTSKQVIQKVLQIQQQLSQSSSSSFGMAKPATIDIQELPSAPVTYEIGDMQAIEADGSEIDGTANDLESPMMQGEPVWDESENFSIAPEPEDVSPQGNADQFDGSSLGEGSLFDSSAFDSSPSQEKEPLGPEGIVLSEGAGGFTIEGGEEFPDYSAPMDISADISAGTEIPQEAESSSPEFDVMPQNEGLSVSYDLDFSDLPQLDESGDAMMGTPASEAPSNTSSIRVREQEAGETNSLRASAPFQKLSLPSGYSWEGDLVICEKDGSTMIYIPAGVFTMGSEREGHIFAEGPEHEITLDPYLIDECPVTWYQYTLFCDETNRQKPVKPCWEIDESQPVVNVSWEDANAYAEWAGKSLCTEAQWEKAAKGGHFFDGDDYQMQKNEAPLRRFAWGENLPNSGEEWLANCSGETQYGDRSPSPVGLYPQGASPYGCLDLCGNVWEWCMDWFNDTYYKTCPSANPKGPKGGSGRVVRGGSWNSEVKHITTTFRTFLPATDWWNIIGFRTCKGLMK